MNRSEALNILGLSSNATEAEVKKAYKKACSKYHPDKPSGDKDMMAKVNVAYDVLTNPQKYNSASSRGGFYTGDGGQSSANDIMEEFLRRQRAQQGHATRGGGGPFDGFFRDSNGPTTNRHSQMFNGQIELSMEDAFNGAEYPVKIPHCTEVKVKVNPGIRPGAKLQITAPSAADPHTHQALLEVIIRPHKIFELDGNDLRVVISSPLLDFYTGATLLIPTLEGTKLNLKLPPNSQPGTTLRVKGKGYNSNGIRGNLYVTVNVELPTLSEDQIEKLKQLIS